MADILERDAGFCSGGDEDDIEAEDGIHSPTDASEDSVDVKVQAISFRNRNKRKCAEPRKLDSDLPAKKRKLDLSATRKEVESAGRSPFRPWSASPAPAPAHPRDGLVPRLLGQTAQPQTNRQTELMDVISVSRLPPVDSGASVPVQRLFPVQFASQEEPLPLVSKRKNGSSQVPTHLNPRLPRVRACMDAVADGRQPLTIPKWYLPPKDLSPEEATPGGLAGSATASLSSATRTIDPASYPSATNNAKRTAVEGLLKKAKSETRVKVEEGSVHPQTENKFGIESLLSNGRTEGGSSVASTSKSSQVHTQSQGQQRNYKNMTRERRIEANARERTRVHTISAAFDTLRHAIPAYSHNQKLSKLSVLRIACSYIMTLSRLAGYDYSKGQGEPDLSSCVDNVSRTIQTEGKVRKKRDD